MIVLAEAHTGRDKAVPKEHGELYQLAYLPMGPGQVLSASVRFGHIYTDTMESELKSTPVNNLLNPHPPPLIAEFMIPIR